MSCQMCHVVQTASIACPQNCTSAPPGTPAQPLEGATTTSGSFNLRPGHQVFRPLISFAGGTPTFLVVDAEQCSMSAAFGICCVTFLFGSCFDKVLCADILVCHWATNSFAHNRVAAGFCMHSRSSVGHGPVRPAA
uniref:Uncharacterized protein n=1 Tax=Eutreptiella gymnastica TaxID=73025 RepID=A0A7S4LEZ3_9EUGL